MKISTKGIYALDVMVDLALHSDEGNLQNLRNVASRRGLSEKYLERIVKLLKNAGLIKSARGAYGGYFLAKDPSEITVRYVLNVVEGELAPVECLTKETDCRIDCDICPTRVVWAQIWQEILDVVDGITISDILEQL